MVVLKDILEDVDVQELNGSTHLGVNNINFDSREVQQGDLFVARRGTQVDGHHFIDQALRQGASAVVCEELPDALPADVAFVKVPDSAVALGFIASSFYGHPSRELSLVGITGTNGKTTITTLLYRLYLELGYKTGLLSTIQNYINEKEVPGTHTTGDPIQINQLLARMVEEKCSYCFMEVSSHAAQQNRVRGLHFTGGVFTNISHDHLDYHGTFENYINAKKKFFDYLPKDAFALINEDDKRGRVMVQNTKAKVYTFSLKAMSDFKGKIMENSLNGLVLNIDNQELHTRMVGRFNAYNILVVYATAALLEAEQMEVLSILSSLEPAEGRFDITISENAGIAGVVDYAHSPDALKNVLSAIKNVRTGNENVITIIGCGGDRDKEKRPLMRRVACQYSDKVILTSDNPRSEDRSAIIQDMKQEITPAETRKVLTIADRKEAIRMAATLAQAKDIVLVAGKGHEKYQEINGERIPFDDKALVKEAFQEQGK